MEGFTINGHVLDALDLYNLKLFLPELRGDEPITEEQVLNLLDTNSDGKHTIEDLLLMSDFSTASHLRNLMRKFGVCFPDPALPDQLPKSAKNPKKEIIRLLKESDFLFLGENHTVKDEMYFVPLIKGMKRNGLRQIAIEVSTDHQEAVTAFLESRDKNDPAVSKLSSYVLDDLAPLLFTADDLGMTVVCIDNSKKPEAPELSKAERNQYMTNRLSQIADKGKTLVIVGSAHAVVGEKVAPTARMGLEDLGYDTTAIKLESQNSMVWVDSWTYHAFLNYFPNSSPEETMYFDSQAFSGATFSDGHLSPDHVFLTPYETAYDAVMFLSEEDSLMDTRYNFTMQ